ACPNYRLPPGACQESALCVMRGASGGWPQCPATGSADSLCSSSLLLSGFSPNNQPPPSCYNASLTVVEVHQLRHWRIGLLGLVVSLLAIYLIVSQVDLNRLGVALRTARYEYVLPAALLLVVGLATRAARWRVLLSGALPLGRAFSITNVSYLVNGLLPLRIGEVARAVLANRVTPPVPVLKSAS